MAETTQAWCYVAEKDGRCLGITASDFEVKEFYSKFAGCEIKPIQSREEWDSYCQRVPFGPGKKNDG